MNNNLRLGEVRVLLADGRTHVRATLKTALAHAGLEYVDHTGSVEAVAEAIDQPTGPDILICDMGMRDGAACDLIQSIRQNELGKNPFLCVIGVTWNPTEIEVEKVIDAGVDLLVAAPMSPKQIFDRVNALVHSRLPFIITGEYIGPDRRKDPDREITVPLIQAPNSLRAKALGMYNPTHMAREIERATREVRAVKVERQAEDIAALADRIYEQVSNSGTEMDRTQLDHLYTLVSDLDRRAGQQGFRHISELCDACVGVVRKMISCETTPTENDLQLLKHLALAIRKSMRPQEGETAIVHDIAQTVIGAR